MKALAVVAFVAGVTFGIAQSCERVLAETPRFELVKIRKCEYVRWFSGGIVHAGDCSNPIHRRTHELPVEP